MKPYRGLSRAELWRWEAAKLRARATLAEDPVMREQLAMFAEDCEDEARRFEDLARIKWRRA
jgi:hypothetical protein